MLSGKMLRASRGVRRKLTLAAIGVVGTGTAAWVAEPAQAGNLFWDATPDAGTTLDYGSGPFSTTDAYWWNGTNYVSWTNSNADVANIGSLNAQGGKSYVGGTSAAAFTLTLGSDITLNQITQSGNLNSGKSVTIANAAGNTFALTLDGSGAGIGNNSGSSPLIVDVVVHGTNGLSKFNGGVVWLKQPNDYTGTTSISGGALRAVDGVGLPANSFLSIGAGVFETSGNFTRTLAGGGANAVRFGAGTNSGGLSAFGGSVLASVGGLGSPTQLVWGSTNFNVSTLVLNAATADSPLLLANAMDLTNSANPATNLTRAINVATSNATAVATVAGVLSSTSDISFVKNGNGVLALTAANTFTGTTTVSGGTLRLVGGDNRLNPNANLTVSSGTLDLGGNGQSNNATVTFAGGTVQNGTLTSNTLAFDSRAGTVSATLTGPVGLNKTTTGLLVLTGANSYVGDTVVTGGTLRAADGVGLPASTLLQLNGGTWETNGNIIRALGNAPGNVQLLGGTSGFSANGGSALVSLGGLGTPTALTWGDANFNPTTLVLNAATSDSPLTFVNSVDLNNTGAQVARGISVNGTSAVTLAGTLTASNGPVQLTKSGSGTLILPNANNYSGTTFLTGGVLALGNDQALGTSKFDFASATVVSTDTTTRTLANALSFSNDMTFGSSNTGNLIFTGVNALGNNPKTATVNNALTEFRGVMSGGTTNPFTKAGPGTLLLSNVANTFSRPVVINNGTLAVTKLANGGANSSIGNAANLATNLIINGGSLQYLGTGDSIDRLFSIGTNGATIDASGSGPVAFTNAGAVAFAGTALTSVALALTGTNAAANRLNPVIADSSGTTTTSLVKNGSGTWVLGGANTYTGSTTVNAGRLSIGVANAIPAASAVNLGGGTFDTAGLNDTAGALTVAATSTIDFGSGASVLTFADSHLKPWNGTLVINGWSGNAGTGGGTDELIFTGGAGGLTTAQLSQIQFAGFAPGATILSSGEVVPTSVPEPVSLGLAAFGTIGLLRRRRRASVG